MLRAVGRAFSAMITAFFLALLALDLYIVVQTLAFHNPSPSVLGWRQLVISSGSMEPAISVGDLILVRRQPAYHEGEVVTYRLPDGAYITHRIMPHGRAVHPAGRRQQHRRRTGRPLRRTGPGRAGDPPCRQLYFVAQDHAGNDLHHSCRLSFHPAPALAQLRPPGAAGGPPGAKARVPGRRVC